MSETFATILISVLGGVNILELIGFIVFYKQNKKSRELDNDNKAANNFDKVVEVNKEVIDMLKQNYKELDDECDKQAKDIVQLHADKQKMMEEKLQLMEQIHTLKMEKKMAEFQKCEVRNCINRQPPTGY